MNKHQRDIYERCRSQWTDKEDLIRKIIAEVEQSSLDFSECTQQEFDGMVDECAYSVINGGAV